MGEADPDANTKLLADVQLLAAKMADKSNLRTIIGSIVVAVISAAAATFGVLLAQYPSIVHMIRQNIVACPVGTIVAYAGPIAEADKINLRSQGWLICDGQSFSKADYRELAECLRNSWGTDDQHQEFRLPDLRGQFLRGADKGAKHDSDATSRSVQAAGSDPAEAGSLQPDAIADHNHTLLGHIATDDIMRVTAGADKVEGLRKDASSSPGIDTSGAKSTSISSETRPRNAEVNWIIRAK